MNQIVALGDQHRGAIRRLSARVYIARNDCITDANRGASIRDAAPVAGPVAVGIGCIVGYRHVIQRYRVRNSADSTSKVRRRVAEGLLQQQDTQNGNTAADSPK